MKISDKKIICSLLLGIILLCSILIYKIDHTPQYDTKLYDEVYAQYNEIIDKEIASEKENNNVNIKIEENKPLKSARENVIALIRISKINLLYPVLSETTMDNLKVAPTRLWGGEPNTVGNLCIIGHNLRNNDQFSKLKKLNINDEVDIIDTDGKKVKYDIYKIYTVKENDLECTSQETNGKKEVTLITCTNNKNKRLIIKCKEKV